MKNNTISLQTRNLRSLFLFLGLIFVYLNPVYGQNCYVRLSDVSGITPTQDQLDSLEYAACRLRDSLPTEFQSAFKVYDFGFYLHNESMVGGYPEAFQKAIDLAQAGSPYYLLFGKQTDKNGVYTRFWVKLKLPETGSFECLDQISPNYRTDFYKKIQIMTNHIYENFKKEPKIYADVEVKVIDSTLNFLISIFKCCNSAQKGFSGCNSCPYSEYEFTEMLLDDYGFLVNECTVIAKANPNNYFNEQNVFNRIIEEGGEFVNVDEEIDRITSEFTSRNPTLTLKVFRFKYPLNCSAFEELWNQFHNDPSDTKMIIGLIGNVGSTGKILWETSGIAPLHFDNRDIGYTVSKNLDKIYSINVRLKIKLINLTKNIISLDNLVTLINIKKPYDGPFSITGTKNESIPCSGTVKLDIIPAYSTTLINPDDHILAIVDDIPVSNNDNLDATGIAKIGGSVALVENLFVNNVYLSLHEIGHLLGLNDDYDNNCNTTSPNLMGCLKKENVSITIYDRLSLFGVFYYENNKIGKWRNKYKNGRNSVDDLKSFLSDVRATYDPSKL